MSAWEIFGGKNFGKLLWPLHWNYFLFLRFPFTAYENGGGAFLIPYIIVLFLIGKPLYYFEMALGQFTSKGSVKALSAIPILKGVAIALQIGTACIVTYYTSLIALTLFFMFKSFAFELPWAKCSDKWLDVKCIDASTTTTANRTGSVSSSELYYTWVVTRNSLTKRFLMIP